MLPSTYGVTRPKWVNMYRIKSFLSNDANLIPCQTNLAFLRKLRLFPNEIWPWKSKVKVMGKVKGQGRTVGQASIQCTSFLFHVNRPNHSIRIPLKLNHIRSMVRGYIPTKFCNVWMSGSYFDVGTMWKLYSVGGSVTLTQGHQHGRRKMFPCTYINYVKFVGNSLYNSPRKLTTQIAKFMGPTWGPPESCRPQMGPMNIAIREMYPLQWQQAWQRWRNQAKNTKSMMTSSNGNIFRVTGHLCGEFTGPRWIPREKASGAELWCFLWSASE